MAPAGDAQTRFGRMLRSSARFNPEWPRRLRPGRTLSRGQDSAAQTSSTSLPLTDCKVLTTVPSCKVVFSTTSRPTYWMVEGPAGVSVGYQEMTQYPVRFSV